MFKNFVRCMMSDGFVRQSKRALSCILQHFQFLFFPFPPLAGKKNLPFNVACEYVRTTNSYIGIQRQSQLAYAYVRTGCVLVYAARPCVRAYAFMRQLNKTSEPLSRRSSWNQIASLWMSTISTGISVQYYVLSTLHTVRLGSNNIIKKSLPDLYVIF